MFAFLVSLRERESGKYPAARLSRGWHTIPRFGEPRQALNAYRYCDTQSSLVDERPEMQAIVLQLDYEINESHSYSAASNDSHSHICRSAIIAEGQISKSRIGMILILIFSFAFIQRLQRCNSCRAQIIFCLIRFIGDCGACGAVSSLPI